MFRTRFFRTSRPSFRRRALNLEPLEARTVPSFLPAVHYDVGSNPQKVIVEDFNRDGLPDLAVSSTFATVARVGVLLNTGDGTLRPPVYYGGLGLGAAGDFNGDGNPDLAVMMRHPTFGYVSMGVLLGNGDGTFQDVVASGVTRSSRAIATGDFNGDGRLDLVMGHDHGSTHGGSVSVLLGNGDGAFQDAVTFDRAQGVGSVAVSDFNGDGHHDLAVSRRTEGVSVLLGNGDGSFQDATDLEAAFPRSLAIGDFNGDGFPDLAVTNQRANVVAILLYQTPVDYLQLDAPATRMADGPFTITVSAWTVSGTIATGYRGTVRFESSDTLATLPADYTFTAKDNGVASFQVAMRTLGNQTITVRDIVTGSLVAMAQVTIVPRSLFYPPVHYAVGQGPAHVIGADLNADGFADMISTDFASDTVDVFLGNGDGTFQTRRVFPAGTTPTHIVEGDFNEDGRLDLAITSRGAGTVSVLLGNGDGTLRPPVAYQSGRITTGVATADFNLDGHLDLVTGNSGTHDVVVFLGLGDGTFRGADRSRPARPPGMWSPRTSTTTAFPTSPPGLRRKVS